MYLVSNHGDIYSVPRQGTGGGFLRPSLDSRGYRQLELLFNDKKRRVLVHHLVLEAFSLSPRKEGDVTRHLNSIRTDNRIMNLRWGTQQENIDDRQRQGRAASHKGTLNGRSILLPADVCRIRRLRDVRGRCRTTLRELAEEYAVSISCIHMASIGKHWSEVE